MLDILSVKELFLRQIQLQNKIIEFKCTLFSDRLCLLSSKKFLGVRVGEGGVAVEEKEHFSILHVIILKNKSSQCTS